MINDNKILALIPARGGSKGLPRKNIIELCGKPLLGWPVQAAKKSKYVDKVIVSTDDQEIANVALAQGAEVPFIRPTQLASDSSSSISVIEHALGFLEKSGQVFDYLLLLEPTSPLTEKDDIDLAIEKLESNREIADSIIGVSKVVNNHPVFDVTIDNTGLIKPYLSDGFTAAGRRQDLDDLYFFDGTLYLSDIKVLLSQKRFYHDRTIPYVTPKWKSFEIDDIVDLICVEAIMKKIDNIKQKY